MQQNTIRSPRNSSEIKKCFHCKLSDLETDTSLIEHKNIRVFTNSVGLQKLSQKNLFRSKPGTYIEETLKTLENMKLLVNELDKTVNNQFKMLFENLTKVSKMLSKKEGQDIKLDYEGIELKLKILEIKTKRRHQQNLDLHQEKCIIV